MSINTKLKMECRQGMDIPDKHKIRNKILMEPDMFYSAAYQIIRKSASTVNTLLRCLQKRKFEKTKINGKKRIIYTDTPILFPYTEAKAVLGVGTTQHYKNIRKLIEVGFLDLDHQGGCYQKQEKDYSRYKLSERWRKYGTPEFVQVYVPKALPASSHIQQHLAKKKLKSPSLKRSGHLHSSEVVRAKVDNSRLHCSEVDNMDNKITESLNYNG